MDPSKVTRGEPGLARRLVSALASVALALMLVPAGAFSGGGNAFAAAADASLGGVQQALTGALAADDDGDGETTATAASDEFYYKLADSNKTLYLAGTEVEGEGYTKVTGSFTAADERPWHSVRTTINKVVFENTVKPTSTAYWFSGFNNSSLTSFADTANMAKLDVSAVVDAQYMFYMTGKYVIDVSPLHFTSCKNMNYMFAHGYQTRVECDGVEGFGWLNGLPVESADSFAFYHNRATANTPYERIGLTNVTLPNLESASGMFRNCSMKVIDLGGFKAPKARTLSSMFCADSTAYSTYTTSVELNGFATSATSMMSFFNFQSNLTSVDLSGASISNVTNARNMLRNCSSLESVTLGDALSNAQDLENVNSMLSGCTSLERIDEAAATPEASRTNMLKVNMAKVTDVSGLFNNCSSLKRVTLPASAAQAPLANTSSMFAGCSSLEALDVSALDTTAVEDMTGMFDGCTALGRLTTGAGFVWSHPDEPVKQPEFPAGNNRYRWLNGSAVVCAAAGTLVPSGAATYTTGDNPTGYGRIGYAYSGTTLTFTYAPTEAGLGAVDGSFGEEEAFASADAVPWKGRKAEMTAVAFAPSMADARPMSTAYWFYGTGNAADRELAVTGIEYLNTSSVTSMADMFAKSIPKGFLAVENDDGSFSFPASFDTSNVTSFHQMFFEARLPVSVDLRSFDTGKVRTIGSMFYDMANSCKDVNVTGWDTSAVTDMSNAFRTASTFTGIEGWDTGSVTDMSAAFFANRAIRELDLRGWDVSKVTNFRLMFCGNSIVLQQLDISTWDTRNGDASIMFYSSDSGQAANLAYLKVGENFGAGAMFPNKDWYRADALASDGLTATKGVKVASAGADSASSGSTVPAGIAATYVTAFDAGAEPGAVDGYTVRFHVDGASGANETYEQSFAYSEYKALDPDADTTKQDAAKFTARYPASDEYALSDGTGRYTRTVGSGASAETLVFRGWTADPDRDPAHPGNVKIDYAQGTKVNGLTDKGGTVDLYGVWAHMSYSVTYDGNGGATAAGAAQVTPAGEANAYAYYFDNAVNKELSAFSGLGIQRAGYVFTGWSRDREPYKASYDAAGREVDEDSPDVAWSWDSGNFRDGASVSNLTAEGNVVLYAQWAPQTFKVTFHDGLGDATEPYTQDADLTSSVKQLEPNRFARAGHSFVGWATSEGGEARFAGGALLSTVSGGGDVELYAVWKRTSYTISFVNASPKADKGGRMDAQAVTYGEPATLGKNYFTYGTADEGSVALFAGWTDEQGGTAVKYRDRAQVQFDPESGSVTLYALWTTQAARDAAEAAVAASGIDGLAAAALAAAEALSDTLAAGGTPSAAQIADAADAAQVLQEAVDALSTEQKNALTASTAAAVEAAQAAAAETSADVASGREQAGEDVSAAADALVAVKAAERAAAALSDESSAAEIAAAQRAADAAATAVASLSAEQAAKLGKNSTAAADAAAVQAAVAAAVEGDAALAAEVALRVAAADAADAAAAAKTANEALSAAGTDATAQQIADAKKASADAAAAAKTLEAAAADENLSDAVRQSLQDTTDEGLGKLVNDAKTDAAGAPAATTAAIADSGASAGTIATAEAMAAAETAADAAVAATAAQAAYEAIAADADATPAQVAAAAKAASEAAASAKAAAEQAVASAQTAARTAGADASATDALVKQALAATAEAAQAAATAATQSANAQQQAAEAAASTAATLQQQAQRAVANNSPNAVTLVQQAAAAAEAATEAAAAAKESAAAAEQAVEAATQAIEAADAGDAITGAAAKAAKAEMTAAAAAAATAAAQAAATDAAAKATDAAVAQASAQVAQAALSSSSTAAERTAAVKAAADAAEKAAAAKQAASDAESAAASAEQAVDAARSAGAISADEASALKSDASDAKKSAQSASSSASSTQAAAAETGNAVAQAVADSVKSVDVDTADSSAVADAADIVANMTDAQKQAAGITDEKANAILDADAENKLDALEKNPNDAGALEAATTAYARQSDASKDATAEAAKGTGVAATAAQKVLAADYTAKSAAVTVAADGSVDASPAAVDEAAKAYERLTDAQKSALSDDQKAAAAAVLAADTGNKTSAAADAAADAAKVAAAGNGDEVTLSDGTKVTVSDGVKAQVEAAAKAAVAAATDSYERLTDAQKDAIAASAASDAGVAAVLAADADSKLDAAADAATVAAAAVGDEVTLSDGTKLTVTETAKQEAAGKVASSAAEAAASYSRLTDAQKKELLADDASKAQVTAVLAADATAKVATVADESGTVKADASPEAVAAAADAIVAKAAASGAAPTEAEQKVLAADASKKVDVATSVLGSADASAADKAAAAATAVAAYERLTAEQQAQVAETYEPVFTADYSAKIDAAATGGAKTLAAAAEAFDRLTADEKDAVADKAAAGTASSAELAVLAADADSKIDALEADPGNVAAQSAALASYERLTDAQKDELAANPGSAVQTVLAADTAGKAADAASALKADPDSAATAESVAAAAAAFDRMSAGQQEAALSGSGAATLKTVLAADASNKVADVVNGKGKVRSDATAAELSAAVASIERLSDEQISALDASTKALYDEVLATAKQSATDNAAKAVAEVTNEDGSVKADASPEAVAAAADAIAKTGAAELTPAQAAVLAADASNKLGDAAQAIADAQGSSNAGTIAAAKQAASDYAEAFDRLSSDQQEAALSGADAATVKQVLAADASNKVDAVTNADGEVTGKAAAVESAADAIARSVAASGSALTKEQTAVLNADIANKTKSAEAAIAALGDDATKEQVAAAVKALEAAEAKVEGNASEKALAAERINALKSAVEQAEATASGNAVASVVKQIDALGTVTSLSKSAAVKAARAAYTALTADEKGKVTNLAKLTAAETAIANLSRVLARGKKFTVSGTTYQVTTAANYQLKGGAVTLTAGPKSAKALTVAASVRYNGVSYDVTAVGANAMKGAKKLAKVTLGKNVTAIGASAFQGCKKLKAVNAKAAAGLKTVGKNAFKSTKKNMKFQVAKVLKKGLQKSYKKMGLKKKSQVK